MIKVENSMLVLDSAFTKEDVLAINEFVELARQQERERIIKLLEEDADANYYALRIIKGEK